MNINVNLKPCNCGRSMLVSGVEHHAKDCAGKPILISCPIPPSVDFKVTLGECRGVGCHSDRRSGELHDLGCPAAPISVSCSISGETWKESEVTDIDPIPELWGANCNLRAIARDRWALVKALLLGHCDLSTLLTGPKAVELLAKRDAVFAALADMARAESTIIQRLADVDVVYTNRSRKPFGSVAANELAAYVSHLITTVGNL
jgi:hypothetical protein